MQVEYMSKFLNCRKPKLNCLVIFRTRKVKTWRLKENILAWAHKQHRGAGVSILAYWKYLLHSLGLEVILNEGIPLGPIASSIKEV